MRVVLLSGPLAVGKTSIIDRCNEDHAFKTISSRSHLISMAEAQGLRVNRANLQGVGDKLDLETGFRWLVDDVAVPEIARQSMQKRWLLDSVRKEQQVALFRSRFGPAILHVHLSAPAPIREERYHARLMALPDHEGGTPYAVAVCHPNELAACALREIADLEIDVSKLSPEDVANVIVDAMREERGR